MNKNVGSADKIIRLVLGVALLGLLLTDSPYKMWGLVGIVPIATALINFCPLYAIFGLRTNKG